MKNLTFLMSLLLLLAACSHKNLEYIQITGEAQGTYYHITYQAEQGTNLKPQVDSLLQAFDNSLSTYQPQSLISRINRNETDSTDMLFRTVWQKSVEIADASEGAFDPTVAPLVNAWGFGFKNKEKITTALIDSLKSHVGYHKIQIDANNLVHKTDSLTMFDFNAIAQGYSVDVLAHFFASKGLQNYLIEVGGEIFAKGINSEQKPWTVGIDQPRDNALPGDELQAIVSISNLGLATSGNYRKFYVVDSVKYAHTIDPKSGYPVQHSLLSATVLAPDCMTADGYATAFMVVGIEKSKLILAAHPELQAYLIYAGPKGEYKVWTTKSIEDKIRK
jgi:thiamine biosynthesis lipoprotein